MRHLNIALLLLFSLRLLSQSNQKVLSDLNAPLISGISVGPPCSTTNQSIQAILSDASGVATGSLAPQCYYKINSGSYTNVQGSLMSGNINSGTWTFSLAFLANVGDTVRYFVVAQDTISSPNVGASPSSGFSGVNVNSISSYPSAPLYYIIKSMLSGNYSVGAAGTFTSLTAAAYAYNNSCLGGPVTFYLTDSLYSSNEIFPVEFKKNSDASSTNSLLICPQNGVNVKISGSPLRTLQFTDSRYITLNGVKSSSTNLTVKNNNAGSGVAIWFASTNGTNSGCSNIKIENCLVMGSGSAGSACIFSGDNAWFGSGKDNDNISITGNDITRADLGIYIAGFSNSVNGGANGWLISYNNIGPASLTNTLDVIKYSGVGVNAFLFSDISKNAIRNCGGGMDISSTTSLTISTNTITDIGGNYSSPVNGILVGYGNNGAIITKNLITNVRNTDPSGYAANGIFVNGGASSSKIQNNMISNIYSYSDASPVSWPAGIRVIPNSVSDIDNNSINFFGGFPGKTGNTGSAAILFESGATANLVRLRNNILFNTFNNSNSSTDVCYAIYCLASPAVFSAINYNDYFAASSGGSNPILGYVGSANQTNISAIQASFGGNMNSISIAPIFSSTSDLHLVPTSNAAFDNLGGAASVIDDWDNQIRNTISPDVGADEFSNPYPCSSAFGGAGGTMVTSYCYGGLGNLNFAGGSGTGLTYQWKLSNTPGGPYSNVSSGLGFATSNYTTSFLSPGNYYYVLETTCSSASLVSSSSEVTVSVYAIPNPSAVIAGPGMFKQFSDS